MNKFYHTGGHRNTHGVRLMWACGIPNEGRRILTDAVGVIQAAVGQSFAT
jgi:hypothetical protein